MTAENTVLPNAAETPRDVLAARWDATAAELTRVGVDVLVVAGRGAIGEYGDVCFLTGVPFFGAAGPAYTVFVPGGAPDLVVLRRDAPIADAYGAGDLVVTECDALRSAEILAGALRRMPLRGASVGIVGLSAALPAADWRVLSGVAAASGTNLVDASGAFARVKMRKSAYDDEIHRRASAIADVAFSAFVDTIEAGIPTRRLIAEVERVARDRGALASIVQIRTDQMEIQPPRREALADGQVVSCVAEVVGPQGYWSEKGGMVVLGRVSDDTLALIDEYGEMFAQISRAIRPGSRGSDLAELAHGWSWQRPSAGVVGPVGHGVGVDVDLPVLRVGDTSTLEAGMSIAFHPHARAGDIGCFAIEQFTVTNGLPKPHSALLATTHFV